MKKITLLLVLCLLVMQTAFAQEKMACCVKPASNEATTQFALLANDKSFVEKHENPLPFTLQSKAGKKITYKTPDGKTASAYEIKAAQKTDNYLFVIHEWWGLNDYMMQEAERLHREVGDVNVIALDLYDGKVAKAREQAMQYMQAVDNERAKAIITGAVNYVGKDADIATIGWCFGGGWSLQAALLAGDQAKAAVIYYGMPERNVERLKELKAPVLGIFAEQDESITPEIVRDFKAKMKEADKDVTIRMYDAVHAFANPSNPKYDKEAAEDAHQLAVAFIKKHLE